MKKAIGLGLAAATALSVLCTPAYAANDIKVLVNGEAVDFTGDQAPVIQDGRTLVPFRFVFEKMGAQVDWFDDIKLCEATYNGITVGISIGSKEVSVNEGSTIESDVPAQIINNRTMVPLRVLSETLGAEVGWDDATRTVTVDMPSTTGEAPVSIEYAMTDKVATGEALSINYKQLSVKSDYTMAKQLEKNINKALDEYADNLLNSYKGDEASIDLETDMVYNDAGVVVIKLGEASAENPNKYLCFGISAGIAIDFDSFKQTSAIPRDEYTEVSEKAGDGYKIYTCSVTSNAVDATPFIRADVEYLELDSQAELNEAIKTAATELAYSFVNENSAAAMELYYAPDTHLFEVPYSLYSSVDSLTIADDEATIISSVSTSKYGEDVQEESVTATVNLKTGEIVRK